MKFRQLIPRKIFKFVASCNQMSDFKAKMHQIRFRLGLPPDTAGGVYGAFQTF